MYKRALKTFQLALIIFKETDSDFRSCAKSFKFLNLIAVLKGATDTLCFRLAGAASARNLITVNTH